MCADGKESYRAARSLREGEIIGMNVPVLVLSDTTPKEPNTTQNL